MAVLHEAEANFEALKGNSYPGRGIVMGRLSTGKLAQVYWVMGRSEGSRNRRLVLDGDVVRTEAVDETKVDPEQRDLIIYNAMRSAGDRHIVSNGRQTDSINAALANDESLESGLARWSYEPDKPNFTPRISGVLGIDQGIPYSFSVIRKEPITGEPSRQMYQGEMLWGFVGGIGLGVHTYTGNGDPLPSFDREPYALPLGTNANDTAEMYWDVLNAENREL